MTASKIVLESIGLRDRPESLIRELYAAAGPLHAEAAPDQPRQPLAGEAFARRIGAGLGQVMIENRLDLRAVDRDLLRSWVEAGPARAPGYHLEFVRGSTPDGLMPGVLAMLEMVINTAPRDDLQVGDRAVTPERLKEEERAAATAGLERWAYYAVNDATGDLVGLTDIVVNSAAPERVHAGNTAVEPAHRGRALGKWLKGAMTQRACPARREAPPCRRMP